MPSVTAVTKLYEKQYQRREDIWLSGMNCYVIRRILLFLLVEK